MRLSIRFKRLLNRLILVLIVVSIFSYAVDCRMKLIESRCLIGEIYVASTLIGTLVKCEIYDEATDKLRDVRLGIIKYALHRNVSHSLLPWVITSRRAPENLNEELMKKIVAYEVSDDYTGKGMCAGVENLLYSVWRFGNTELAGGEPLSGFLYDVKPEDDLTESHDDVGPRK